MDIFNFGSLLMMLAMIGVVIFLGATGRLAALAPDTQRRELLTVTEENAQYKKDLDDLRTDNAGLHHTVRVLAEQGSTLAHRNALLEAEAITLRNERDGLLRRNAALEAAFESRLGTTETASPLQRLRQVLAERFSESELKQLCADLKVDYEDIEGDSKGDKAFNLVAFFERRGEAAVLSAAVRKARPNAKL